MVEHAQAAIGPALPQGRQRMVTKPGTPLASHPRHNEFAQEGALLMSAPAEPRPSRPIRFVHRGAVQEVSGVPATTTVLQWLREQAHCTGTKEGCAEGDCGACTVVVGESDPDTGAWRQKTVNACIQFLPTLDGKALVTVEDLQPAGSDQLHPCQQAMVDCHGSQCGFCTPGFVMSLFALQKNSNGFDKADTMEALAGNLCRCTGYRPIIDAAEQACCQKRSEERS